jgi:hypothetical protein
VRAFGSDGGVEQPTTTRIRREARYRMGQVYGFLREFQISMKCSKVIKYHGYSVVTIIL